MNMMLVLVLKNSIVLLQFGLDFLNLSEMEANL